MSHSHARSLPGELTKARIAAGLSISEVHRRLVKRGLPLPLSSVWRWFSDRADGYTPSPGQLYLLGDVLGLDPAGHLRALQVASNDLLESQAERHASGP